MKNQNSPPHDNRRKFVRIALDSKVKVVYRGAGQRDQILMENISEQGLFLASEQIKPIGTKLHFEFRVQNSDEIITGLGIVRWIESDPNKRKGMGIQFIEINPAGEVIMENLMRKRGLKRTR
jgi:Tfp pilus assembly protein PilZ